MLNWHLQGIVKNDTRNSTLKNQIILECHFYYAMMNIDDPLVFLNVLVVFLVCKSCMCTFVFSFTHMYAHTCMHSYCLKLLGKMGEF